MVENLLFSSKKLFACLDNLYLLDEEGMVVRKYYDGQEFNDRQPIGYSSKKFLDSNTVYTGLVDEEKITTRMQTPDELGEELFVGEKVL